MSVFINNSLSRKVEQHLRTLANNSPILINFRQQKSSSTYLTDFIDVKDDPSRFPVIGGQFSPGFQLDSIKSRFKEKL